MGGTAGKVLEELRTKEKWAKYKSELRQRTGRIEVYDWIEGELDLRFLRVLTDLAELFLGVSQATTAQRSNGLLCTLRQTREMVVELVDGYRREWPEEVIEALQCTDRLLDQATVALSAPVNLDGSTRTSGGATTRSVGTETLTGHLPPRGGSGAAPCSTDARVSQEGERDMRVATIYGPVGYVETEGERVELVVDDRWADVLQSINTAIGAEKFFVDVDETPRQITANLSPEELATLANTIRACSRGDLTLSTAQVEMP